MFNLALGTLLPLIAVVQLLPVIAQENLRDDFGGEKREETFWQQATHLVALRL